jgi:hypothetical protein
MQVTNLRLFHLVSEGKSRLRNLVTYVWVIHVITILLIPRNAISGFDNEKVNS